MGNFYHTIISLLVIAAISEATFNPTVTFSCSSGPVYNLTVTNAVSGGVIFIEDYCGQQNVTSTSQTFTFDSGACTSVPPLDTTFYIVVQEYASLAQLSDLRIDAICSTDLSNQTATVNLTASQNTTVDQTETSSIAPVFTTSVTSDGTNVITSGEIGDPLVLVVSIQNSFEQATFGFKVLTVLYDDVEIVTAGCSNFAFFPNPSLPTSGSLSITSEIVRPLLSSEYQLTTTTLTVSFTIQVCNGTCTTTTCSRRRRSADEVESEDVTTVKSFATLLVYPPGLKPSEIENRYAPEQVYGNEEACLSRTPMVIVMVCLAVALLVCVAISGWMFCKLRYAGPKRTTSDGFSNSSYKS